MPESRDTTHDGLSIVRAGIEAVQADRLIESSGTLDDLSRDIEKASRVFVVGAGKASLAMASVIESEFGDHIADGVVAIPEGYRSTLPKRYKPPTRISVIEAGHPIPNRQGILAAGQALELAVGCNDDDLVIALISGGSSALWAGYSIGISMDDAAQTTKLLLESGATIQEINVVRKHISSIGGGRLAAVAAPAAVRALVISDVVGDDVSSIGSGPCSPDATTYSDALLVIHEYGLDMGLPVSVRRHLHAGAAGIIPEPPKPGSLRNKSLDVHLIGSNKTALEAMSEAASDAGYAVNETLTEVIGEAREIGTDVADAANRLEPGSCVIWGGETTVSVVGNGRGGRNQEVALAAAIRLQESGSDSVVVAAGTDGIDGLTEAAGAWSDRKTVDRGKSMGVDARIALAKNDSGTFFSKIGQAIVTGPTHTNVTDVGIALRDRRDV